MQKYWHSDSTQRPNAQEIYDLIRTWYNKRIPEVVDELEKAEESRLRIIGTKKGTQTLHPGAIYTSRLMTNITNGKKFYSFRIGFHES